MSEKSKIAEAIKLINAKFGNKETKEVPIPSEVPDVPIMSTGIIGIDRASNCGGIPEGRIFEVFGMESSGKTSIALLIAKKYAEQGKTVAFIDAEQAFNMSWAKKLGIPVDDQEKFVLVQSSVFEEIFGAIRTLIEVGDVKLIIVDSVASISTQEDFENEEAVGKGMPLFAKKFRRELRMLTPIAAKNKCNLLFLNHQMVDMAAKSYVPVATSPGGTALKYLSSMRMQISKSVEKDDAGNKTAARIKVQFPKNKIAAPYGSGSFVVDFNSGVDHIQELVDYSLELKIVNRKTPREYIYKDIKVADTAAKFYSWIESDKNIQEELLKHIYSRITLSEEQLREVGYIK